MDWGAANSPIVWRDTVFFCLDDDLLPYVVAVDAATGKQRWKTLRPDMLVRFDPATENFQSWPIKSGNVYAGILRNARTTRQGTLLIHQTATNRVIEVTPQRTRAAAAQ